MAAPLYFIATYSSSADLLFKSRQLISPRSHPVHPGGLVFEVNSRYRQETLDRIAALSLANLRIGGAFTRTAAVFAALVAPGTILPYRREKGFLASFPLEHLSLQAELPAGFLDTLHSWGLRTFGDLTEIAPAALAARMGQDALQLRGLAAGEDVSLPESFREDLVYREKREFDWPVASSEALLFPLGEMMEAICGRVSGAGLAVCRINLLLTGNDGENLCKKVETALPSCNSRLLISLLRLELEEIILRSGIKSVELEAFPARARIIQHSLLEAETLEPEEKGLTLSLAERSWPESSLGIPGVMDTHDPDPGDCGDWRESRLLKGRNRNLNEPGGDNGCRPGYEGNSLHLALRRERPPRPLELAEGEIVSLAGPWKSSGCWWVGDEMRNGWTQEEWDLELKNGELYRVSWNHREKIWYLEGTYD